MGTVGIERGDGQAENSLEDSERQGKNRMDWRRMGGRKMKKSNKKIVYQT